MIFIFSIAGCSCRSEDPDPYAIVTADLPGAPIPALPQRWVDRFRQGEAHFDAPFREAQGLGPVYVRGACSSCHGDDGRGPGLVEKMVVVDEDGITPAADQDALPWGHTVRPFVAGGASTPVTPPDDVPLLVTRRAPPPVFGRGYVEAVLDSEIERVAAEQAAAGGPIHGHPNHVPYQSFAGPDPGFHDLGEGDLVIGRFGLKARIGTADDFAADAYQGDMSLTSPLRPDELPDPDGLTDDEHPGPDLDADTVRRTADYVRLLAIPAREPDPDGLAVFADTGCATCHVPTLHTRPDDPVAPLADVDAPLFTDLLLHDLGAAFSDGLPEFEAGPSEWKTPPLVGLRFQPTYLHDGRATTILDAIEAHGEPDSEAVEVIEAFDALDDDDRDALVAFVSTL